MPLKTRRRFVLSKQRCVISCSWWLLLLLYISSHFITTAVIVVHGLLMVGRLPAGPSSLNLDISEMGCGTWSWGNRLLFEYNPNQDEDIYQAYQLIRRAGVTIFDTADSYGTLDLNGRAEILLGKFERRFQQEQNESSSPDQKPAWSLWSSFSNTVQQQQQQKGNNGADDYSNNNVQQVATKFAPYPWRLTPSSFVNAAKASLKRLDQSQLCIAQAHWSTKNYLPQQESVIWNGLADVYEAGLCRAVGVSNYGPDQLAAVSEFMATQRDAPIPLAVAQVQYSLLTFQDAQYMNQACQNENAKCALISYSPLCLGLLTGKYNLDNLPRPGNPRRQLFRELLPGAQELLATLDAIARDQTRTRTGRTRKKNSSAIDDDDDAINISCSQVAINWAMCKGTVPIPGIRTVQQARENLRAVGWRLRPDQVAELDRVALKVKKPMIQNIFQTR
jgi:pyridoxine 4-dehydrogenase